ncbi:MAG: MarR family transcriptional regulator [Dehalococcoidia bacterium]|nr:MarR family transcriptional regulator [Dehalococcoidia bacterium]MDD5494541.1 MarR family transcriptional regulator [Dehalococcoidia bacterium]
MAEKNNRINTESSNPYSLETMMVPFYFHQAYKAYSSAFQKMLQIRDLTPSQCMTLMFLRFFDAPLTASRIARLLSLETHSVTSLLDHLQKRKLVRRRRSKSDRRVIEVILTDQGRQTLREVVQPYLQFIDGIFISVLSPKELEEFTAIMQKVRDAGITWQGSDPEKARSMADKFARWVQSAGNRDTLNCL